MPLLSLPCIYGLGCLCAWIPVRLDLRIGPCAGTQAQAPQAVVRLHLRLCSLAPPSTALGAWVPVLLSSPD